MGIPWWAAVLAAPLVGQKVASGLSDVVDSLNRVNDVSQQRTDLKNYQMAGVMPDPTKYKDVETGMKTLDMFQKKAAPNAINTFRNEYEKQTGTTDPRFFGDAEGRAELAKFMPIPESGKNPYVDADINAFRKEGEQVQTLKAAAEGDPLAAARISADKDLASSAHLGAQAVDIPIKRRQAQEKEDREQQKLDFNEAQKKAAEFQQSEFDRIRAGIGGRYQQAQPIVDGVAPTGPNVYNGLDYSDAQGKVTPRQIMPYDEAHRLITQAKADYPLANADKAFSDLDKLYEGEHSSADYTPTATNWKGNVTKDMTQLQYAASNGDRLAQRLLDSMENRELRINKAKAEDRRLTVINHPTPDRGQEQRDFRNESAMRKEFLTLPEVKDYPTIEQNSKRALAALAQQGKGSNVAIDQSIITVFNKMLDPTSVVRESEYARTPQDLGVLSRIKGKWEKVQRGGAGLNAEERQALYRMVQEYNKIAGQQYNAQVDYYTDLAQRYGYKPENIVRLGGKRSDEGTGKGGKIAPAGTKVAKRGGGFYTSDGKGGWY